MVFPDFGLQYALIGGGLSDNVQAHIGRRIDDIAGLPYPTIPIEYADHP